MITTLRRHPVWLELMAPVFLRANRRAAVIFQTAFYGSPTGALEGSWCQEITALSLLNAPLMAFHAT